MALEAAGSNILDRAPEILEALSDMQEALADDCACGRLRCKTVCEKMTDCPIGMVYELIRALQSELERVQKERDAAVEDLKYYGCICCTDYETGTNCKGCNPPKELPNFKWNGKVVKENIDEHT